LRRLSRIAVEGLRSQLHVHLVPNEHKRLQIDHDDVVIHPRDPSPDVAMKVCFSTFEDFCVVTQSVREGIDASVNVSRSPTGAEPAI